MADSDAVNDYLQRQLRARGLTEVTAVEAATWLDADRLLDDSEQRPGLPLRNLLRDGLITGAEQRPPHEHGRWFIRRIGQPRYWAFFANPDTYRIEELVESVSETMWQTKRSDPRPGERALIWNGQGKARSTHRDPRPSLAMQKVEGSSPFSRSS